MVTADGRDTEDREVQFRNEYHPTVSADGIDTEDREVQPLKPETEVTEGIETDTRLAHDEKQSSTDVMPLPITILTILSLSAPLYRQFPSPVT